MPYVPHNWDSPNWAADHWLDWEYWVPQAVSNAWWMFSPDVKQALASWANEKTDPASDYDY